MAFYCDKDTVLSLFRDGTEVYYQQSKYEVGEVIRTVSPRNEGKLGYSRSLEHFSALLTGDTKTTTTKQNTNNQQSDGRDVQGKTISFTSYQNNNTPFVFEKEKVEQNISEVSKLSENIVPIKFLPFRVFLPKKFEPPFVIVRLPETETLLAVLEQAIKQYNEVSQNPLPLNLRAYQLFSADSEGTQEELALLSMDQTASKMGKDFVIVINDIRQPSMDRGPLVIRLPDGTKATVQFQVGMRINEVVRKVCDKRNLSAPDFHLKIIDGTTLTSDTTVQELPNEELQLIPNVEESIIDSSDSTTSSVSTAFSAFKWKVFEVTYGKRKNFSIGIDGEYIQIFKKKTGFSKEKKETRPFSDLISIIPGNKSSKTFTITWNDGKQDVFDSSQRQAIISKIETIQMRRKEHTYL